MWRKREKKENTDFRKDIPEYSDEQLIAILKLRDHYQPEAAKLAVNEALKRGIINSEQDLLAEEYRCEPIKFSLFPEIKKKINRVKIRKSIARSLVLCRPVSGCFWAYRDKPKQLFGGYRFVGFRISLAFLCIATDQSFSYNFSPLFDDPDYFGSIFWWLQNLE